MSRKLANMGYEIKTGAEMKGSERVAPIMVGRRDKGGSVGIYWWNPIYDKRNCGGIQFNRKSEIFGVVLEYIVTVSRRIERYLDQTEEMTRVLSELEKEVKEVNF